MRDSSVEQRWRERIARTELITQLRLRTDLRLMADWRGRAARRHSHASYMLALGRPEQQALVEQLRAGMPSWRAPGAPSSGDYLWNLARRRVVEHVRDDDPRRFLRWPEIRATMFVANSAFSSTEVSALKGHHGWSERWKAALTEDPCGCPTPSRLASNMSDQLIHHAYHALTIEERLGSMQDFDEIVEFGGGYGSFPRLFRRLGITSRYHIHDFPEFVALQRYYLASVALSRGEASILKDVTWGSSIDELPIGRGGPRLFVALWSLSETLLHDRGPWHEVIAGCDAAIIAFQSKFGEIDNRPWVDELRQRGRLDWTYWEMPHIRGSFYLVGRR
jgi:hypothetical protein